MKYSINPEDIKIRIAGKQSIILGGAVAFTYRVKATHVPTDKTVISNGHTSIKSAVTEAIEDLEEKVYLHNVYKNKHNVNEFWKGI